MIRLGKVAFTAVGTAMLSLGMAGCMGEKAAPVGANAMLETSGNKIITWSAPAAGRLSVVDKNTNTIVYGGKVTSGQAVKVDVDSNRISLDSQIASEGILHGGDQYTIYFEPTSTVEKTATVETNSVETVHEH